jgi:hypothetical protein
MHVNVNVAMTVLLVMFKPHAAIFHIGQKSNSGHCIEYLKQAHSKWICANDINISEKRWPNNTNYKYKLQIYR